jgi:hypothetical protein
MLTNISLVNFWGTSSIIRSIKVDQDIVYNRKDFFQQGLFYWIKQWDTPKEDFTTFDRIKDKAKPYRCAISFVVPY